jgi:hypothetical protein
MQKDIANHVTIGDHHFGRCDVHGMKKMPAGRLEHEEKEIEV